MQIIADSNISVPEKHVRVCFAHTPTERAGVFGHDSDIRAAGWSNDTVGRELLMQKEGSFTSLRKIVQCKGDIILIKNIQTIVTWNGTFIS